MPTLSSIIESVTALAVTMGDALQLRGFKTGGTAGQVPTKTDGSDYTWSWQDQASGGGGAQKKITTSEILNANKTISSADDGKIFYIAAPLTMTLPGSGCNGAEFWVLAEAGTVTISGSLVENDFTDVPTITGQMGRCQIINIDNVWTLRRGIPGDLYPDDPATIRTLLGLTALATTTPGATGLLLAQAATPAAALSNLGTRKYIKTANSDRTNTSTLAADSVITGIPVVSGTSYRVTVLLRAYNFAGSTGGVHFRITGTPVAFPSLNGFGLTSAYHTSSPVGIQSSSSQIVLLNVSNTPTDSESQIYSTFSFRALATANIALQFCQNNAVSGATLRLQPGSYLLIEEF